jgi:hypothetical protein
MSRSSEVKSSAYFPNIGHKNDLIKRMIEAIKSAQNSTSNSTKNDFEKLTFGQTNLGEYFGYLSESRDGIDAKGEFTNLEELEQTQQTKPYQSHLVYSYDNKYGVAKSAFLLPENIKNILTESGVTNDQLKDAGLFKSFLLCLSESYEKEPAQQNNPPSTLKPEEAIDKIIFRSPEFVEQPDGTVKRKRHEYKKCLNPVVINSASPTTASPFIPSQPEPNPPLPNPPLPNPPLPNPPLPNPPLPNPPLPSQPEPNPSSQNQSPANTTNNIVTKTTKPIKKPETSRDIQEIVDEFIKDNKIDEIYPDRLSDIRKNLASRWKSEHSWEIKTKQLVDILRNRESAVKAHNKIVRQEADIRAQELGKIDDQLNPIHEPRQVFRELLFDQHLKTKDQVIAENTKFLTLAIEDRKATDEEIAKNQKFSPASRAIEKGGKVALSPFINILKHVGRGTFHNPDKDDLANDTRYLNYLRTRDRLIEGLRQKLGTKNPEIERLLNKFQSVCDDNNAALGEADLLAIQQELVKEIAKIEGLDELELKAVKDKVDALNESTKKQINKNLAEEFGNAPYIALQIALLVTPLAGLSVLPMLGGIIEPMFDENLTFGKSIGAVIANIPGFGPLLHAMKVDYAIAWFLDNCPIVEGATKILHETTNNIFTNTGFDMMNPLLGTAAFGLGIAGLSYGNFLDPKIAKRDGNGVFLESKADERERLVKDQKDLMKEELTKMQNNGVDLGNNLNSKDVRQKLIEDYEKGFESRLSQLQIKKLKEEIEAIKTSNPSHLKEIFFDIETPLNPSKSLAESLTTDQEKTFALLLSDRELLKEAAGRIIAYNHKDINKDINKFKNNQDQFPRIIENHHQELMKKITLPFQEKMDLAKFIHDHDPRSLDKIFDGIEIRCEMSDGTYKNKSIGDLKGIPEMKTPSKIFNFFENVDPKITEECIEKMTNNLTPSSSIRNSSKSSYQVRTPPSVMVLHDYLRS